MILSIVGEKQNEDTTLTPVKQDKGMAREISWVHDDISNFIWPLSQVGILNGRFTTIYSVAYLVEVFRKIATKNRHQGKLSKPNNVIKWYDKCTTK